MTFGNKQTHTHGEFYHFLIKFQKYITKTEEVLAITLTFSVFPLLISNGRNFLPVDLRSLCKEDTG